MRIESGLVKLPPGLEVGRSQRAVENREKWRKLVAKSSVVPPTTLAVKRWMMMMMR